MMEKQPNDSAESFHSCHIDGTGVTVNPNPATLPILHLRSDATQPLCCPTSPESKPINLNTFGDLRNHTMSPGARLSDRTSIMGASRHSYSGLPRTDSMADASQNSAPRPWSASSRYSYPAPARPDNAPQARPRPVYSHSQRESTNWIKSPLCDHCGSLTPRSGITTVYGTPIKSPRSFLEPDGREQVGPLMTALEKLRQSDAESICLVEKVHDKDDVNFVPYWKQSLHRFTPFFSVIAVACYWLYFGFRIHCTRQAEIVAQRRFVMAWVFIMVEMGVAFPMLLHQFWQCFLFKGRMREKLRLVGSTTPTVDVFVTCCGEDRDVVVDTVRAAADQDWPMDRFRVIVLDDKNDNELRRMVEDVKKQYPHVFYTARQKIPGVPHHFKAGNLNHGFNYVHNLEGGAGEYMAALDADMIPEPEWLRAIIAHLVIDPELALSCPPQLFYNVPKNDPLLQSLNSFVHIAEPVKDAAGVAWCTGSGYAIRRSALEQIGGFPTGSLAEDVCTSSMLLGAGWKTAYVHEPLQFGTVPDSFTGHIKQRTRWTIGTIQTSAKLNFCLFGPLIKDMSLFQRLSGFVYTVSSLFTIFLTATLFTMPIVLISGGTLVAYANFNQLRWLIRFCFFALIANRVNEWVTYIPAGYRLGQRESGAMMWMAPFHAIAVVRSFLLPRWLGGKIAAFASSGSISCELNERDLHLRAPLRKRLRVILIDCLVIMHVVYILFCIAAVTLSTVRAFTVPYDNSVVAVFLYLLTHAAWPPILWLVCLTACWAPVHYAIWPPATPDREELLDRDPMTGVAHPKQSAKMQQWDTTNVLHELLYGILTSYTTALFIGTWFY